MSYRRETQRWLDSCKYEYSDTFCRLGEVLLSFSSGVLLLVTFGSSFWLEQKDKSGVWTHSGLWQTCTSDCKSLPLTAPGVSAELLAARTFLCIALAVGMLAWVMSIVGMLQHRARWLLISAVCYAAQGFVMVLGLGSFSKSFNNEDSNEDITSKPGWSYSVGWVACVLSIMCTLYFISVAVYRLKFSDPNAPKRENKAYAPLAQFESTETDDDENL